MRAGESVPEWDVTRWLNGEVGALESLRGRVVVVHAFQMLCPGCIYRGLPQAMRLAKELDPKRAVVLGLHTVFEHHEAMREVSLEAFLSELRVPFPVGVDRHEEGAARPITMRRWDLRGTPSTVIVDAEGRLAHQSFGAEDDLELGLRIGGLLERASSCDALGCVAE
ncbi:MAG: TlpA disulfide reductase family protein [Sandaracinaceae bacterium]